MSRSAQRSKPSGTRQHAAQTSWFHRGPGCPLLVLVCFASGAAALISQVHWSKQLALVSCDAAPEVALKRLLWLPKTRERV
jgi:hypothetical protein